MAMIRHSMPTVGDDDLAMIAKVVRSRHVGYGGKIVEEFERRLCRFIGTRHAVATNSGTAALHLALLALGVKHGGQVILPTYTCAAVLNAVKYTGATPVLVDIDPRTFNIDPDRVRDAAGRKTRAIIVPHMFGLPAEVRAIRRLGIPVVEDCSMAVGARIGRRMTGTFGDVAIASFYATKVMTTGGGGALFTDDRSIAARVRDLVNYDNRDNYRVRYNYGMSALNAAVGLSQLAKLPGFLKQRRQIAEMYYGSLESLPLELPAGGEEGHVFYRFVARAAGRMETVARRMADRGIECKRPVWRPLHRYLPIDRGRFPAAEEAHRRNCSIPIYPEMTDRDVRTVIDALRRSL